MKYILMALLFVTLVASNAFCDTAVQQDQNAGYLSFAPLNAATATISVSNLAPTFIYSTAPSSYTTWIAAHPGSNYIILPRGTKGFTMTAFGADMIINHPTDLATGTIYVGTKVANGSVFKWESRRPEQSTINFAVMVNGTGLATATFTAWGE